MIYDRLDLNDWVARRKRRFTGESVDEREPGDAAPRPKSRRRPKDRNGPEEAGE